MSDIFKEKGSQLKDFINSLPSPMFSIYLRIILGKLSPQGHIWVANVPALFQCLLPSWY